MVDHRTLVGIITVENIRFVPRYHRESTLVSDMLMSTNDLIVSTPDEDAADALNKLVGKDVGSFPSSEMVSCRCICAAMNKMGWLQPTRGYAAHLRRYRQRARCTDRDRWIKCPLMCSLAMPRIWHA